MCKRKFDTTVDLLRMLDALTAGAPARTGILIRFKAPNIFKRIVKVGHPTLTTHALRLIKRQVPRLPRRWRAANLPIITAIYKVCETLAPLFVCWLFFFLWAGGAII